MQEFKQAKFLLTLRDCYGWLDSFINFCLRSNLQEPWLQFRALRFGSKNIDYDEHELLLKQHGLYPLKGYLSYWNNHQRAVFDRVPKERLMVVKTNDISASAYRIAKFAGFAESCVKIEASHVAQSPKRFGILSQLDPDYLDAQVNYYCGELMGQYFPQIRSVRDLDL